MTLQAVLQSVPLDQIGASHGKYLKFDAKNKKWSTVNLNCLERFIRWLGLAYGSTTLKHIATQIEKENVTYLPVLQKIQASWNHAYPAVRSPLKAKPCTLQNPAYPNFHQNILSEAIAIGQSYFNLHQDHHIPADTFAGFNLMELPLHDFSTKQDLIQAVRNKLEEGSRGLDANGNVIQNANIVFTCRLQLEDGVIQKWMGEVISTIETFLHEQNKLKTPRNCGISFENSEYGAKNLAETIKICREMKHPHGQIL